MIIVLMGVSGSGKTTIGKLLTSKLSCPYFEADEFHSADNIRKMSAGIPLDDGDREPWLAAIASKMKMLAAEEKTAVFTCSALKHSYRETLRNAAPGRVVFFFLNGPRELIASRLTTREQHFMPAKLLDSQLEALEVPQAAIELDISVSPEELVSQIIAKLPELQ